MPASLIFAPRWRNGTRAIF